MKHAGGGVSHTLYNIQHTTLANEPDCWSPSRERETEREKEREACTKPSTMGEQNQGTTVYSGPPAQRTRNI